MHTRKTNTHAQTCTIHTHAHTRANMCISRAVTVATVADHVCHIVKVAGIDHVGIGGDYDGCSHLPVGLADVSGYPELLDGTHAHACVRRWKKNSSYKTLTKQLSVSLPVLPAFLSFCFRRASQEPRFFRRRHPQGRGPQRHSRIGRLRAREQGNGRQGRPLVQRCDGHRQGVHCPTPALHTARQKVSKSRARGVHAGNAMLQGVNKHEWTP